MTVEAARAGVHHGSAVHDGCGDRRLPVQRLALVDDGKNFSCALPRPSCPANDAALLRVRQFGVPFFFLGFSAKARTSNVTRAARSNSRSTGGAPWEARVTRRQALVAWADSRVPDLFMQAAQLSWTAKP